MKEKMVGLIKVGGVVFSITMSLWLLFVSVLVLAAYLPEPVYKASLGILLGALAMSTLGKMIDRELEE